MKKIYEKKNKEKIKKKEFALNEYSLYDDDNNYLSKKQRFCCSVIKSKKSLNYGKICGRPAKYNNFNLCGYHKKMYPNNQLKSKLLDQYYTLPSISKLCIDHYCKHVNINFHDLIIEPCAGIGSFIPYIIPLVKNKLFIDIDPKLSNIIYADFLNYKIEKKYYNNQTQIHIITNPPFKLLTKFIKKIINDLKIKHIGLIVPVS